ncbi:uncharacterized protein [Mytilus edulis]|uniref:uncharacterized protein isoform X2 n=1 Tax=Mytilus edulis TaxID=6550 RepID=UPI0039EEAEC3
MKLRSGKTTRRSRNNKMNNLQGFHPLSPVPGTKVGEGTIAKEIKTITEEETEEANPDTSENLIQPEEQGAAAPLPKTKDTVTGGAGIEFGSKTKRLFKLKIGTIICSSIPKYVKDINGCTTQAFPGATIARLSDYVSSNKINLKNKDFIIVHVGSNNIAQNHSVDMIISYYSDLIHNIQIKSKAKIIITSILPRLIDHNSTAENVRLVNSQLKKLCVRRNIQFSNIYKSFLCNNLPDASLYAPRDGLHLNFTGTSLLRKKFINIIRHLSIKC